VAVQKWKRAVGAGYLRNFSVGNHGAGREKLSTDFHGGEINTLLNKFITEFLVFPVGIWI